MRGEKKSGIKSLSTEIKQLSPNHKTLYGTVIAWQEQLGKIQEDLNCTKQEMSDLKTITGANVADIVTTVRETNNRCKLEEEV